MKRYIIRGWVGGGVGKSRKRETFFHQLLSSPPFCFSNSRCVCNSRCVNVDSLFFFFFFLYFIFFLIKSVFHSMADVYTRVSIVFFSFFRFALFFFIILFFFYTFISCLFSFCFKSISSSATLPSRTSWAVENNTIA